MRRRERGECVRRGRTGVSGKLCDRDDRHAGGRARSPEILWRDRVRTRCRPGGGLRGEVTAAHGASVTVTLATDSLVLGLDVDRLFEGKVLVSRLLCGNVRARNIESNALREDQLHRIAYCLEHSWRAE